MSSSNEMMIRGGSIHPMFPYVTAIDMTMKEGMQPGYYAQIVKKLADTEALIDRDRSLLFVKPDREDSVVAVLRHYGVAYERSGWLRLGLAEEGWELTRLWSDYGVETRSGVLFMDSALGILVSVEPGKLAEAEPAQAQQQLDEHALAVNRAEDSRPVYAIDRQQLPLAEGIARAYGCTVVARSE